MRTPAIIVNFKAYEESLGPASLRLAKLCEEVADETGASIAIAPAQPDLARVAAEVKIPVLAQHFDPVPPGNRTGWVPLEAVRGAGAIGSLLNHSERKIPIEDIEAAVKICGNAGLESIVCADTVEETRKVAEFSPDYVAIEPPELIGGDISVTTARPGIVTEAVAAIEEAGRGTRVMCGAGVKTWKDVHKALELGTVGVLLASGVVKAGNPRKALQDLAHGLE